MPVHTQTLHSWRKIRGSGNPNLFYWTVSLLELCLERDIVFVVQDSKYTYLLLSPFSKALYYTNFLEK